MPLTEPKAPELYSICLWVGHSPQGLQCPVSLTFGFCPTKHSDQASLFTLAERQATLLGTPSNLCAKQFPSFLCAFEQLLTALQAQEPVDCHHFLLVCPIPSLPCQMHNTSWPPHCYVCIPPAFKTSFPCGQKGKSTAPVQQDIFPEQVTWSCPSVGEPHQPEYSVPPPVSTGFCTHLHTGMCLLSSQLPHSHLPSSTFHK